jgi:hypothetical protein
MISMGRLAEKLASQALIHPRAWKESSPKSA